MYTTRKKRSASISQDHYGERERFVCVKLALFSVRINIVSGKSISIKVVVAISAHFTVSRHKAVY